MSGSTVKSPHRLKPLPVVKKKIKVKKDCAVKTNGSSCLGSVFLVMNSSPTVVGTSSSIAVVAESSSSSTNSDSIETSCLLEKSASSSLKAICESSLSSNDLDSKEERIDVPTPNPKLGQLTASENMPVLSQPTVKEQVEEQAQDHVEELAQMFPLISTNFIEEAYFLCNENMADTIDHLLAKNMVDREREDQSMSSNSTRPLCKHWVSNQCGGARAAACTDRHYFTESDSRKEPRVGQTEPTRSLKQFSSPFREQVLTEQVLVSKEQVDLESGTAETVWEIKNREVVDLTGMDMNEGK